MRITQDGKVRTNRTLENLIKNILLKEQLGLCAECSEDLEETGYQITHKRYGLDITIKDLDLKCGACHAREHGFKSHTGTLRKIAK